MVVENIRNLRNWTGEQRRAFYAGGSSVLGFRLRRSNGSLVAQSDPRRGSLPFGVVVFAVEQKLASNSGIRIGLRVVEVAA
jgi:hypothetical protein